jgi:hypothetical protein
MKKRHDNSLRIRISAIGLLVMMLLGSAQADTGGPQNISMAGAFMVTARGVDAALLNPANLGYSYDHVPGTPNTSITFLGINARAYNNAVSPHWINNSLFGGLNLDEGNNRSEFLNVFNENGWDLQALFQMRVLGIAWRNFSLTITPELQHTMSLPSDLMQMVFDGVYFDEPISLAETSSRMQAVVPIAFSYGQPLDLPWIDDYIGEYVEATYVGGGIKTLLGIVCGHIDHSEGELLSQSDSIAVNSRVLVSTVGLPLDDESDLALGINGVGFAFDLGLAVDVNEKLHCGLTFNNLFGRINWSSKHARSYDFGYQVNLSAADIEEISGYSEAEMDSLQEIWAVADSSFARDGFSTPWPSYMQLGAQYQLLDWVDLSAVYKQGFNPVLRSGLRPRLAVAGEVTWLPWLPVRLGMAVGGMEGFEWGTGFGLAFTHYQLDFGFAQSGGMFNWARGMTFGLEQRVTF